MDIELIALNEGQVERAAAAYQQTLRLCSPDFVSSAQDVLHRHRARDVLKLTPECAAFLKEAEKEISK